MGIRRLTVTTVMGVFLSASSCGYTLQSSRNPVLHEKGIRTVYVAPVQNNTYKTGIDNLVYNQLIKVLSAYRTVRLVRRPEDADAILQGAVTRASFGPTAATVATDLFPTRDVLTTLVEQGSVPSERKQFDPLVLERLRNTRVAIEYAATLNIAFSLNRKDPRPGQAKRIWTGSFSDSRRFPANNQLGMFGNTSPLINDSDFDRALRDLAENMMGDLHESMLAMF